MHGNTSKRNRDMDNKTYCHCANTHHIDNRNNHDMNSNPNTMHIGNNN